VTDIETDRPSYFICNNRPHLCSSLIRTKNKQYGWTIAKLYFCKIKSVKSLQVQQLLLHIPFRERTRLKLTLNINNSLKYSNNAVDAHFGNNAKYIQYSLLTSQQKCAQNTINPAKNKTKAINKKQLQLKVEYMQRHGRHLIFLHSTIKYKIYNQTCQWPWVHGSDPFGLGRRRYSTVSVL